MPLSPTPSSNSLSSSSAVTTTASSSSSCPPTRTSSSTSIAKMADITVSSVTPITMHVLPRRPTKIRFAPLPDPRRSVLVTEQGDEFPLADELNSISIKDIVAMHDIAHRATPDSELAATETSPAHSLSPSPAAPTKPLPTSEPSPLPSTNGSSRPSSRSGSPNLQSPHTISPSSAQPHTKKKHSWLSPFKRSSSSSSKSSSPRISPSSSVHSLTPTHPPTTSQEVSAVTINLIRSTSIESTASHGTSLLGLQRFSSNSSNTAATVHTNSQLTRTFSAQSANMPPKAKKNTSKPGTGGGFHLHTNPRHRGQRMLNGRVYGGPKHNPFANVRDEEPEFVEWGYGGMGSIKSAAGGSTGGPDWAKVQGNISEKGRDQNPTFAASAASRDEDDGSGMAWVKKRREQREREKKEREAAAAAAEAAEPPSASVQDQEGSVPIVDEVIPEEPEQEGLETDAEDLSTPTQSRQTTLTPTAPSSDAQPVITNGSLLTSALTPGVAPKRSESPLPAHEEEQHFLKAVNMPAPQITQSPGEEEDDGSESSPRRDDDDDDDDEDEQEDDAEMRRRLAQVKGAGVEKISRHHQ